MLVAFDAPTIRARPSVARTRSATFPAAIAAINVAAPAINPRRRSPPRPAPSFPDVTGFRCCSAIGVPLRFICRPTRACRTMSLARSSAPLRLFRQFRLRQLVRVGVVDLGEVELRQPFARDVFPLRDDAVGEADGARPALSLAHHEARRAL